MRLLLAAAVMAAIAVPAAASAEPRSGSGFTSSAAAASEAVRIHRGGDVGRGDFRRDDRRRDRARGDVYFPYRDYQGDSLWRPESFNDWWHERPQRAYPAWMARNQNCERQYWSGGGWRC